MNTYFWVQYISPMARSSLTFNGNDIYMVAWSELAPNANFFRSLKTSLGVLGGVKQNNGLEAWHQDKRNKWKDLISK